MEKYDVAAMGELLIDFTQNGYSEQGNPIFEANPGGAPCNVLAMLQKLGRKTAFIGKVGQDGFGLQLEKALKETGISTEGLCFDKEVHTTLAVVQKKEDGDRDFLWENGCSLWPAQVFCCLLGLHLWLQEIYTDCSMTDNRKEQLLGITGYC